jgi:hypothetical protein
VGAIVAATPLCGRGGFLVVAHHALDFVA